MTLYQIYEKCGYRVSTDTRTLKGGELFFALKGENFDGNLYAMKALEAGALYAVVDENAQLPSDGRLIRVPDTFKALQQLAVQHREQIGGDRRLPVLGLTGTNGKTTTKNLILAVLSAKYRTVATEGNLNNDIGVPLSILKIRPDTEMAVIEMGANHPDDIAKLVQVSRPDFGLITNVGKAHLLGFGSFEGVKAAKGELYRFVGARRDAVLFVNHDDPDLMAMASAYDCDKVYYGLDYQNAEVLPATPDDPFVRVRVDGAVINSQLVGAYNALNILAAIAVGRHFGVSLEAAADAVAAFTPNNNRSQMKRTERNVLIVDAYNANPSSMSAALENFAAVISDSKSVMLGDMRELGADSVPEHEAVVRRVQEMGVDAYFVGDEFRKALDNAGAGFRWFASSAGLASFLHDNPVSGRTVLVKGSRGIEMEKVLSEL